MKYYFLTDKNLTFTIGPFLKVIHTPEKYVGQIIRSNEYSEYLSDTSFEFILWVISSNENSIEKVKYWLHLNLSKLSDNPNVTYIGKFEGIINETNTKLELVEFSNIKYILEFKINQNILYCPSLTIEYTN
jgi:hypothetical protein